MGERVWHHRYTISVNVGEVSIHGCRDLNMPGGELVKATLVGTALYALGGTAAEARRALGHTLFCMGEFLKNSK